MSRFLLPALAPSWRAMALGHLVAINYGSALTASARATSGAIPVYGSGGLVGTHDQALHNARGIVIGRKGSVGSVYLADEPFWCIDTAYYFDAPGEIVELDFLAAYLKSIGSW